MNLVILRKLNGGGGLIVDINLVSYIYTSISMFINQSILKIVRKIKRYDKAPNFNSRTKIRLNHKG